jgi:hypothetical protein
MPTIPTSVDFDLLDWSDTSGTDITGVGPDDGILANASTTLRAIGVPHSVNQGDAVLLSSDDGVLTDLVVAVAIVEDFTLEFELRPADLPASLADPAASRVFLAASDAQGNAAGLLLSRDGIAVVAQPGNAVLPFSQSKALMGAPNDYLSIRLTTKAATGVLDIYITPTASLATTGHVLRYTLQAPASAAGLDKAHIEVLNATIVLREFRLSSQALSPHNRPIADAGEDQTVPLGGVVRLTAEESRDPEGGVLTYQWTLTIKPDGSTAQLSGAVAAFLQHAVGGEGVKYAARTAGSGGNAITVEVVDLGAASALKTSLAGQAVTIILAHDGARVTTTFEQIHQALTNPLAVGYDLDVALLITATLVGSGFGRATALPVANLAAGEDSSAKTPSFAPDKPGTYQFQLVVNDGTYDSLVATTLIVVMQSAMHLGHIPDAEFVWKGLSDFWTLVPDKAPLSTFWSAALQAISSEMLKAWQDDYAKSLRDIQRLYVRKWLRYTPFLDDRADPSHVFGRDTRINLPVKELSGTAGEPLEDSDGDLTSPNFIDRATTSDLSALDYAKINLLVDIGTGKTREIARSLNTRTVVLRDEMAIYDVIDTGVRNGKAKDDGDLDLFTNLWSSEGAFKSELILTGDILRITGDNELIHLYGIGAGDREMVFVSKLKGTDGHAISVELVEGTVANVTVTADVHNAITVTYDTAQAHTPADVRAAVAAHVRASTLIEVTYGDGDGTDALLAADAFNRKALAGISTIGGVSPVPEADSPPVQSKILAFLPGKVAPAAGEGPHREVPTDTTGLSWEVIRPTTAFAWKVPAYVKSELDLETDEVVTKGDQVRFEVANQGTGAVSTVHCEVLGSLKTRVAFDSTNLLAAVGGGWTMTLKKEDGDPLLDGNGNTTPAYRYTYQGVVRLSKIPVDEDLRSTPRLVWPVKEPSTTYNENADYTVSSKAIAFDVGTFDITDDDGNFDVLGLPPDELWGEVNYFSNEQAIENNFGRRAGLLAEDVGDLDYLSAVRALWYAYLGGPKVSNLHLGAQVFLGLSIAEVAGVISSIDDLYTETQGQIVIADKADPAILRSYLYPRKAGVADNLSPPDVTDVNGVVTTPAARPYVVGDEVAQFAPLTKGVTVDDYVKSPRWFVSHLRQGLITEVEKFFTFRVRWSTKAGSPSATSTDLAAQFMQKMKPVYTSPILVGLHEVVDDAGPIDKVIIKNQMRIVDNPRGAPNEPNNPKDSIGHPAPVVFDSFDGEGNPDLAMDNSSPRSDVTVDPANLDTLILATPLPSYDDGVCPYLTHHKWVVLLGPPTAELPGTPPVLFPSAGVYRLLGGSTASALKLGTFAAPYDPVALVANAAGVAFTLRDTPAAVQTLLDADPKSPVGLLHLDSGVWEPKAVFDGGIVPYFHTVNRAVIIDLQYDYVNKKKVGDPGYVAGNSQKGPRFDQGLIFDDTVGGKPNMHNSAGGGTGLFWWFDGGAGVDLATPDQGFYRDYADDGQGYDRPDGAILATGNISRVVGHEGLPLPATSPHLLVDPLP